MELYSNIFQRIDNHIVGYAAAKSTAVAALIEPAVMTGMSIYLLFYGYKHMKGEIEQPFMAFVDSAIKMVVIAGVGLGTARYAQPIIDTFQGSPVALASAITGSGATNMPAQLDATVGRSWDIAMMFFDRGGLNNLDDYLYGALVIVFGFIVTAYTAFLMLISKISTGILLALTPLFVVSLMWEKTQGFFGNYLNTLINQGMVLVLAVATNEFILTMFQQTVADVATLGAAAKAVNIVSVVVTGLVGLFILAQVTSTASSLAGGVSLSTFGMGRAAAKMSTKAMSKITGGQGRENQRSAKNQINVQERKEKLVARTAAKKRKPGTIERKTGTHG